MKNQLITGVYRHYSGFIALVLGVARHSETEEKLVVYIPLGAKAGPRMTVRPLDMFLGDIELDGQTKPRFEFIGTEMPADLAETYRQTAVWGRPSAN